MTNFINVVCGLELQLERVIILSIRSHWGLLAVKYFSKMLRAFIFFLNKELANQPIIIFAI